MKNTSRDCLKICDTCPWLRKNHGKPHPAGWYKISNLRRLWAGLRSGDAPGIICHSTDDAAGDYGGSENIQPGRKTECGGAWLLLTMNMNAISEGKPQPITPPLNTRAIALIVERFLIGRAPTAEDRREEIGVPWRTGSKSGSATK